MSTAHLSFAELMAKAKSDALNPKVAVISKTQADEAARKREAEAARARQALKEERERKDRAKKKQKELEAAQRMVQDQLEEQARLKAKAAEAKERAVVESTGGGGPKDKATQAAKSERLAKQERWKRKLFQEDDDDTPTTYAPRTNNNNKIKPLPGAKKTTALPGRKGSTTAPGKKLTGKAALMAEFNTDMVALNQNKRDRRTVEEVERDMRANRPNLNAAPGPSSISRQSSTTSTSFRPSQPLPKQPVAKAPQAMPKPSHSILKTSSKPSPSNKLAGLSFRSDKEPARKSPAPAKRKVSPPPAKKRRLAEESEEVDYQPGSIYALMGRNLNRDARLEDSDEYESDDMEAGAHDLEMEEQRAAAFARKEEREEEERERKRVLDKQKRLAAAAKR